MKSQQTTYHSQNCPGHFHSCSWRSLLTVSSINQPFRKTGFMNLDATYNTVSVVQTSLKILPSFVRPGVLTRTSRNATILLIRRWWKHHVNLLPSVRNESFQITNSRAVFTKQNRNKPVFVVPTEHRLFFSLVQCALPTPRLYNKIS